MLVDVRMRDYVGEFAALRTKRVDTGVYYAGDYDIEKGQIKSKYPHDDYIRAEMDRISALRDAGDYDTPFNWDDTVPSDYGICDNWEQITEKWPFLVESERKFVILLTDIYRENQSDWGGFRFHKWGEYIGVHQEEVNSHEYIYDTNIDKVVCFSIVEVN